MHAYEKWTLCCYASKKWHAFHAALRLSNGGMVDDRQSATIVRTIAEETVDVGLQKCDCYIYEALALQSTLS